MEIPTAQQVVSKEELQELQLQMAGVTPEQLATLVQPQEMKAETSVTSSETQEMRQVRAEPPQLQQDLAKTEVELEVTEKKEEVKQVEKPREEVKEVEAVPTEERQETPRPVEEQTSKAPRIPPEEKTAQTSQSDVLEETTQEIAGERPEAQAIPSVLEQTEVTAQVGDVRQPEVQSAELKFLKPLQAEVLDRALEFECQIQTDLQPVNIRWLHDGQELRQSTKYETTFFEELGTARLTVKEVGPADAGEYACVVTRDILEPSEPQPEKKSIISHTIVTLTDKTVESEVQETFDTEGEKESGQSSPLFEVELAPVQVTEGDEIYLSAVVKGVPQPTEVTWKHNGVVLQQDTSDSIIYYLPESGLCELTISEAFPEDAGVYEVEAQNPYGMAVSQTEVQVNDAESAAGSTVEITSPLEEVVQTAREMEILVQPTEELAPIEVLKDKREETTLVSLPAVTEAQPFVQTAEVQGPKEVLPAEVQRTEHKFQLQADVPVEAPSAEMSTDLEVRPAETREVPSTDVVDAPIPALALIQDLHPTTELQEGQDVQLIFEVTEIPETSVTWLKEEQIISSGEHYVVEFDQGVGRLTIAAAKLEDSGLYRSKIQTPTQEMELQLPLIIPRE
ncbi:unnamed protein product [Schistocephalus solidus]|uniref:Titin n=1 Tax=Schistocephalus solidus TaxID=70667 RepID=A0A183SB16_SCHSO|nr:unnamed protein product [Schistocephalus solidus]